MSLASTEAKPAPIAASDVGNRPSMDAVELSSRPRRSPSSPSPPPRDRLSSSSPTTATFSERNDSETVESGSLSSEDGDGGWPRGANAMKQRDKVKRSLTGCKGQKMCAYELCPSPLHSKKWRVVTAGTCAGGRDWEPLVGQTLCDSCYSTYRKHGTFVRSVRTNEGWSRTGEGAAVASDRILVAREVIVREKPERTDKIDKPKKASPQRAQRVPKRPRWHDSTEEAEAEAPPKRRDRKAAVKSAWWSHGSGNMTEVETELLDAVAILRSLQNSPPCPQLLPEPAAPSVYYSEAAAAAGIPPPPAVTNTHAVTVSYYAVTGPHEMEACRNMGPFSTPPSSAGTCSSSSPCQEGGCNGSASQSRKGHRKTPDNDENGSPLARKAEQRGATSE
jgi:hypothetical protein